MDDSKATNGHAARASLSSFPAKSVIWIAGGLAKGSRFEDLVKDQAHTIKAAVIIGKDQQPMIEAFASQAPDIPVTIIDPEDNDTVMDRAVEACGTYAAAGDIVLMAPACASMDQFKSYADRAIDSPPQPRRGARCMASTDTHKRKAYRVPDKPALEITDYTGWRSLLNPLWCYHGFRMAVVGLTCFG